MEDTKAKLLELKRDIKTMSDEDVTGWSLIELSVFSKDLFSDYYDLTGHRVDRLMRLMREAGIGVVP